MARAGPSRENLQQAPAHVHYAGVQILVRRPEPLQDALPCAEKNGLLIKTGALGWDKHVTPGEHTHKDISCTVGFLKLKHIHIKKTKTSPKIRIDIKHILGKIWGGILMSLCFRCAHVLVPVHLQ